MFSAKNIAVSLAVLIVIATIFNMVVYGVDIISVIYFVVLLVFYIRFKSLSDTL